MTTREDIRAAIEATLTPLLGQRASVDEAIARAESELKELHAIRRDLTRVINAASPPETKQPRGSRAYFKNVSDEKLDQLEAYLNEHATNGEEVTTTSLMNDPSFNVMSRATLVNALPLLVERGVLRRDAMRGKGGGHVYKLIGTR